MSFLTSVRAKLLATRDELAARSGQSDKAETCQSAYPEPHAYRANPESGRFLRDSIQRGLLLPG